MVDRLLCFLIVGIQASGISIPLSLLMLCTYQFKAGGGGGRAWGGDLIVTVGPGVGLLTNLAFPGRGYLNLPLPNVDLFERQLERKRLRPKLLFPRHACTLHP